MPGEGLNPQGKSALDSFRQGNQRSGPTVLTDAARKVVDELRDPYRRQPHFFLGDQEPKAQVVPNTEPTTMPLPTFTPEQERALQDFHDQAINRLKPPPTEAEKVRDKVNEASRNLQAKGAQLSYRTGETLGHIGGKVSEGMRARGANLSERAREALRSQKANLAQTREGFGNLKGPDFTGIGQHVKARFRRAGIQESTTESMPVAQEETSGAELTTKEAREVPQEPEIPHVLSDADLAELLEKLAGDEATRTPPSTTEFPPPAPVDTEEKPTAPTTPDPQAPEGKRVLSKWEIDELLNNL